MRRRWPARRLRPRASAPSGRVYPRRSPSPPRGTAAPLQAEAYHLTRRGIPSRPLRGASGARRPRPALRPRRARPPPSGAAAALGGRARGARSDRRHARALRRARAPQRLPRRAGAVRPAVGGDLELAAVHRARARARVRARRALPATRGAAGRGRGDPLARARHHHHGVLRDRRGRHDVPQLLRHLLGHVRDRCGPRAAPARELRQRHARADAPPRRAPPHGARRPLRRALGPRAHAAPRRPRAGPRRDRYGQRAGGRTRRTLASPTSARSPTSRRSSRSTAPTTSS